MHQVNYYLNRSIAFGSSSKYFQYLGVTVNAVALKIRVK